ncbi:MAG: DUF885 domain-containing protein [Lachnospiraceae bacterium]|nr:DUF885 domain-containing protein [Lachnospiraceae bacterium]
MKKKALILISAVIVLAICFVFYYVSNPITRTSYRTKELKAVYNTNTFLDFSNELFCYEVSSNSVTQAYTLANPSNYNIPDTEPTLTDFSNKEYKRDNREKISSKTTEKLQNKLMEFDLENLSQNEQITYDLLKNHLDLSNKSSDYSYYETLLGSTTGAASTLAVTLCEYPLNDSEDVTTYLELLTQIPSYFHSVIEYENEKLKQNKPTPDFILEKSATEMESFIKALNSNDNCYIETFNLRLNHIKNLTPSKKKEYSSKNKYYVNQYVIPSYKELLDYINKTLSKSETCDEDVSYGLSSFNKGKEYYELIVKDATGSGKDIQNLKTNIERSLNDALSSVLKIATTDPDAYMYYCDHPVESNYHSPEGILDALSLMIRDKYPTLESPASYKVKTVPKCLSTLTSPAYYMIPQIDNYTNNTIYINPLYTNEQNGNLFTTLAHEGFPGHLYQTVYYNSTKPLPIRQILDYPGYVEGWATYVELDAFDYIDYPQYADSLSKLYRYDAIINLALSSRIDIGVNYEGWTINDTKRFFEDLGFNSYYAFDIYSYVVEAPAKYLSYFVGYLEIEELKQEYKNYKMGNYTDKDFHKALLDIGPADFETIRKYLY